MVFLAFDFVARLFWVLQLWVLLEARMLVLCAALERVVFVELLRALHDGLELVFLDALELVFLDALGLVFLPALAFDAGEADVDRRRVFEDGFLPEALLDEVRRELFELLRRLGFEVGIISISLVSV